jgi:hypothetical protein
MVWAIRPLYFGSGFQMAITRAEMVWAIRPFYFGSGFQMAITIKNGTQIYPYLTLHIRFLNGHCIPHG